MAVGKHGWDTIHLFGLCFFINKIVHIMAIAINMLIEQSGGVVPGWYRGGPGIEHESIIMFVDWIQIEHESIIPWGLPFTKNPLLKYQSQTFNGPSWPSVNHVGQNL